MTAFCEAERERRGIFTAEFGTDAIREARDGGDRTADMQEQVDRMDAAIK